MSQCPSTTSKVRNGAIALHKQIQAMTKIVPYNKRSIIPQWLIKTGTGLLLATSVLFFCRFSGFTYPEYLAKTILGSGRILHATECQVFDNQILIKTAKCFPMEKNFSGQIVGGLTVLMSGQGNSNIDDDYFVIWRKQSMVGIPNTGKSNNALISEKFLYQADSGSFPIVFCKGDDVQFKEGLLITENSISFMAPVSCHDPKKARHILVTLIHDKQKIHP